MSAHVPIQHQIACVKREIAMRRRVYPRWVEQGRTTQALADDQIAMMEAVLATLERVQAEQTAKVAPGLF
jgi:hypothetical protein